VRLSRRGEQERSVTSYSEAKANAVKDLLRGAAIHGGIETWQIDDPLGELVNDEGIGELQWVALVITIEIDLRVDIPDDLGDSLELLGTEFADRVAALPEVDDALWTYNRVSAILLGAIRGHDGGDPEMAN
jgi:hypothetical protein